MFWWTQGLSVTVLMNDFCVDEPKELYFMPSQPWWVYHYHLSGWMNPRAECSCMSDECFADKCFQEPRDCITHCTDECFDEPKDWL